MTDLVREPLDAFKGFKTEAGREGYHTSHEAGDI